jgi:phosphoinositide-3-kinase regulatory subunit 4
MCSSTRPFLEEVEKRWIAFQLLCGLRDCHAQGIHHGDIKAENVLVTSWNWIYLTDFATFKPTYLPADNPADFSYFFDTSGRRICYVAPERFLDAGEKRGDSKLTDEMDIFSLGCVIAELFLEGTALFTLSQLFKYRSGEYDPAPYLARIEDVEIRQLVQHMINTDPSQRYSAEQYLNEWRRTAFPEYFYSFLHQYISFVTDPTSGRAGLLGDEQNFYGRADDRIDRIYHDFDKISFFLGFEPNAGTEARMSSKHDIIPVHLDIPNYQRHSSIVRRRAVSSDDGSLIFLSLVASSVRNTSRTGARVRACDIILALAERITDEAKIERCLPYLVSLLTDENVIVQVTVVRTLAQLVSRKSHHIITPYLMSGV